MDRTVAYPDLADGAVAQAWERAAEVIHREVNRRLGRVARCVVPASGYAHAVSSVRLQRNYRVGRSDFGPSYGS